jgi:hypothetical protein
MQWGKFVREGKILAIFENRREVPPPSFFVSNAMPVR